MRKDRLTLDLEYISDALGELEHQLARVTVSLEPVRIAVADLQQNSFASYKRDRPGMLWCRCWTTDISDSDEQRKGREGGR